MSGSHGNERGKIRVEKNAVFWAVTPCGSRETSVLTRSTRRHIAEDGILHSHRRDNLKRYIEHEPSQLQPPVHVFFRTNTVTGIFKLTAFIPSFVLFLYFPILKTFSASYFPSSLTNVFYKSVRNSCLFAKVYYLILLN
jgi:hypothetical protein